MLLSTLSLLALLSPTAPRPDPSKPFRLPSVDLKQPIIWGSVCEEPEGDGLAFGGQDQRSEDGKGHTRIKIGGQWVDISKDLKKWESVNVHLEKRFRQVALLQLDESSYRRVYFPGRKANDLTPEYRLLLELQRTADVASDIGRIIEALIKLQKLEGEDAEFLTLVSERLWRVSTNATRARKRSKDEAIPTLLQELDDSRVGVDILHDLLGAEPPPRALSPIVYDPKTKLYLVFGGDHLDYLMNDVWLFDPVKKQWTPRLPKESPPPRANHKLKANGDGTITLTAGYTYANNTDYMGGQYKDLNDGEWIYDIATNTWKGKEKGVESPQRVYRSGPFHPSYFMQEPHPDRDAFAKWLDELPVNTWKMTKPPHLPQLNRDWGTAVLDPDRDVILRWSGGHSAHGGTDVLHFHLATNRWELPFPVEFPLGQLYTNTEYPDGWNFNKRPWITGHTYQNYAYEARLGMMVFVGRPKHTYYYDPKKLDWDGVRQGKPKGMSYDGCFYTLTLTPTPDGVVCWTQNGELYLLQPDHKDTWVQEKTEGEKLPGAVVDNSTLVYDSKRNRLLFFRKGYGDKAEYDGEIHEMEWKTKKVRKLSPQGMKDAKNFPYLCQIRYHAEQDILLGGCTLPPDADGFRRTPAYDCVNNQWISLKITGEDPSGVKGRNVSLGMMYDKKRNLFWAVDTKSQVYVLKLDVKQADGIPLGVMKRE